MDQFIELLKSYQWYAPLMQLIGLMILGYLLGIIPCIVIQTIKAKSVQITWVAKNAWAVLAFAFLLSFAMGIGFKIAFAPEMTSAYSIWLGFFLWLGSWDFYRKLKESDSAFGKYFSSIDTLLKSDDIVNKVISTAVEDAKKETEQVSTSSGE